MGNKVKFYVVVDMQHDFIDGTLGTEEAQNIVGFVADTIREARKNKDFIVFTMDTHYDDYLATQEGKYLPVKHCIEDSHGWSIPTEICDAVGDWFEGGIKRNLYRHCDDTLILTKDTFGSIELCGFIEDGAYHYSLNDNELDIVFMGLCTDICVVSNALIVKAAFPNAHISVLKDGCAGTTPEKHEAALEVMRSCQIDVI